MSIPAVSSTDEQVVITASPISGSGKPALVDGPLRVTVVSGGATFTQDAGTPLVVKVVSEDVVGSSRFRIAADADLGAGVVEIEDFVDYTYGSPTASAIGLVAGPVEPKGLSTSRRRR